MENAERRLQAKADMVAHAIMLLAKEMAKGFEKDSKEVRESDPQTKDALYLLLTYTNVFNAEQFFSEQLASHEYKLFVEKLESHFNPEGDVATMFLGHIRKLENWLPHFGSEVSKIIGGDGHGAELAVSYASFADGFFDSLKRAWTLVSDYPSI